MSRERAIIIGGFSESSECLAPLTNAVAENLFSNVEQLTWNEAYEKRHTLARAVLDRTIITHSAGAMFLKEGQRAITLSGPEPTHPAASIIRAGLVALNSRLGHEDEVAISMTRNLEEILQHPNHLRILGRVGTFSTSWRLILAGAEHFPDGRYYLPSQHDEFGFTRQPLITQAAEAGIVTGYVGRFHNHALAHPKDTVAHIRTLLEKSPATT